VSTIDDITVLDGGMEFHKPVIVLDLEFARKAVEQNEIALFVHQAVEALELSGKNVVYLEEAAE
jgi:hypothetical protein